MPITVVSALPKTAPTSQPENAAGSGSGDAVQDFASLLFGQMFQSLPALGPGGDTLDSANDGSGDETSSGDASAAGDPLALIAALTQAPIENRNIATPAIEQRADGRETSVRADAPLAGGAHGNAAGQVDETPQAPTLPTETPAAANESKAAKFAVPALSSSAAGNLASTEGNGPERPLPAASETTPPYAVTHAGVHAGHDAGNSFTVATPVRDPHWNSDFAQKVAWLATSHKQSAELTLTPPDMGNIEISLHINNDKSTATAHFVSTNAEVRETIETALPRLREMLAGVGIELGQANVSAESFKHAAAQGGGSGNASPGRNDNAILAPERQTPHTTARTVLGLGRGLVDTFA